MDQTPDPQRLAAELEELRTQNCGIKEELQTLEILYQNLIEHGEAVEDQLAESNIELAREKKKADDLLLNILPVETAEELKISGTSIARSYEQVTVMFTDFKGFTQISELLTPQQLVAELDRCFRIFDEIIGRYPIEKIKTIGDSYLCAGGLPTHNETHAFDLVSAALEFQHWMKAMKLEKESRGELFFEMRIGIHTGPVVAGIVGAKKFAYDIWGDTVNTASRMESSSTVGKVNISGETWQLVKERFNCVYRGKIAAKNKGAIDMYFVESVRGPAEAAPEPAVDDIPALPKKTRGRTLKKKPSVPKVSGAKSRSTKR